MQDFFPPNPFLSLLLQDSLIERGLGGVIVFDPFLLNEGLNLRIAIPLFALVLVTADMQVGIREEGSHLAQKNIKKFVGGFSCRVEGRLKDARGAFNLIRTGGTSQFRIADQPTGGVPGNIKFGYYSNTTISSIR